MKIDLTTKEILTDIHNNLLKEDIDVAIQEIGAIAESQFLSANMAFKKGLEVRIPFFGTFVRKYGLEKNMAAAKLIAMKDTFTKETYERKRLEDTMANIQKTKKRRATMTKVSFKEFKETKNLVKTAHKYDKIV